MVRDDAHDLAERDDKQLLRHGQLAVDHAGGDEEHRPVPEVHPVGVLAEGDHHRQVEDALGAPVGRDRATGDDEAGAEDREDRDPARKGMVGSM